jgi:hypothetical protein
MESSSQTISATAEVTTEIDVSSPFPVFSPVSSKAQFPSITFGSIGIPFHVSPFAYASRPQNNLHIPTTATVLSMPQSVPAQQPPNFTSSQPQRPVIPTLPNPTISVIPSFTYSGLVPPYQGVFPTSGLSNPMFPTPYMLMVSPEVWGAGQQGWIENPAQLAHMQRLEELQTRLVFT